MPNTYHQIYIQAVFAVKYRAATIKPEWKKGMCAVLGNLINETKCKTLIVNGVTDHVHLFFGLQPKLALSDVMRVVKSKSSKWVNESSLLKHRFEWQTGFGAFSYSHSQIQNVYKYILHQEQHHQKQSFREEYLEMLQKFGVEYNDEYIFEELI